MIFLVKMIYYWLSVFIRTTPPYFDPNYLNHSGLYWISSSALDPTSQKPSNVGLSVETFLRLTWNSRTHSHLGSNTHLHSHNYKNSNYCSLAAAILHLQPAAPSPSPPAVFTPQALSLLLPRRRKTISFVGGIIPSFPRHGPEQQQLTSVCVFQQMWV